MPAVIARRTMRAVRTRRRTRTRQRAIPCRRAHSRSAGRRSYERSRVSHGRRGGGGGCGRRGGRTLLRGTRNIICGCHTPRKSARPDAAGDRHPRQRGRDRGRGYARHGRAAAPLRHRDAARFAARAQRGGARRGHRARIARGKERRAGERRRHAGDQRSRGAARARRARGGMSGGARSRRVRRDRGGLGRGPRPPIACCSWASCPRQPRRGANCWHPSRACPPRSSSTRRRIASAPPWPPSRRRFRGERSLVVAREITKKFETIAQMTLAEASAWFEADPNRERGEFVLLVDAPGAPVAASGEARARRRPPAGGARRRVAAGARRARCRGGDRPAARRALRAGAGAEARVALTPSGDGRCRTPRLAPSSQPLARRPDGRRASSSSSSARPRAPCSRRAGTRVRCACRRRSTPKVPTSARRSSCIRPAGSSAAIRSRSTSRWAPARTRNSPHPGPRSGTGPRDRSRAPRPRFVLPPGAILEWLPQETMLFDGARASIALRVDVAPGARFIGWDVTCLGRTASGERFTSGALRQTLELHRADALLYCERAAIDGGSRALQSGAMLDGAPVFGTLLAAGAPIPDERARGLPRRCRSVGGRRRHAAAGGARRALSRRLGARGAHVFCYAVAPAATADGRPRGGHAPDLEHLTASPTHADGTHAEREGQAAALHRRAAGGAPPRARPQAQLSRGGRVHLRGDHGRRARRPHASPS